MMQLLDQPSKVLRHYLLPTTIAAALTYLADRLETATLFFVCQQHIPQVFQAQFPREWMQDQEQLLPELGAEEDEDEDKNEDEEHQPYSKGEWKCLELIADYLIPFHYDYMQMVADEEGRRSETLPLQTWDLDLGEAQLDKEVAAGWQMLGLLNGSYAARDQTYPPDVLAAIQRARSYCREVWSWDIFHMTCARCQEPLSFLAIALQILDHATDNLFLDPTSETLVEDADLTLETFELLIEEWETAQKVREQGDQLAAWLTQNPKRIRKVVDLWNLATWNMLMAQP